MASNYDRPRCCIIEYQELQDEWTTSSIFYMKLLKVHEITSLTGLRLSTGHYLPLPLRHPPTNTGGVPPYLKPNSDLPRT